MKKRLLIGCGMVSLLGIGLLAGLGALLVGWALAVTRPVADVSEEFLALVGQGKVAEAYASASEGFRAEQDEASFTQAVKQLGLTDYSSVSWDSRQVENREGTAEGTVTTRSGGTYPVCVRLVQAGGRWAVAGVRYRGVELEAIKVPPVLPEAEPERGDSSLGEPPSSEGLVQRGPAHN
jgi:hypothetical protein